LQFLAKQKELQLGDAHTVAEIIIRLEVCLTRLLLWLKQVLVRAGQEYGRRPATCYGL
jgi:hypothetical protein